MASRSMLVLAAVLTASTSWAQQSTDFNFSLTFTSSTTNASGHATGIGTAFRSSIGPVAINVDLTEPVDANSRAPLGDFKGVVSFVFNRLDSFDVGVDVPNGNGAPPPIMGSIANGKGIYQGAGGSVTFTFTGINGPLSSALITTGYSISATGSLTVSGSTTPLTLSANILPFGSETIFRDSNTGSGMASPLGSFSFTSYGHGGDNNTRQVVVATLSFNANDSFSLYFYFIGNNPPPNIAALILGGTGAYAGATGSATLNITAPSGNCCAVTGSGSIATGAMGVPVITNVTTAFSDDAIAQNDWAVIQGMNLVPANTPSNGVTWSNAPSFASGQMPTQLQGVSVTVNGVPAYVYFYCSAATDPSCATDQINILTPLDILGDNTPAGIVVTNGLVSSAPFVVNEHQSVDPSFLLFSTKGHVVGVHLDGSLLGPNALYPGLSTPAKAGETVSLFAVGFGVPSSGAIQGAAIQVGSPAGQAYCSVGGLYAEVPAAIISPGLTQLNVTIPNIAPSGDNQIWCSFTSANAGWGRTPAGNLLTVQ